MEMPYMYEEGLKIKTKISFRVGDINLEIYLNLQEIL